MARRMGAMVMTTARRLCVFVCVCGVGVGMWGLLSHPYKGHIYRYVHINVCIQACYTHPKRSTARPRKGESTAEMVYGIDITCAFLFGSWSFVKGLTSIQPLPDRTPIYPLPTHSLSSFTHPVGLLDPRGLPPAVRLRARAGVRVGGGGAVDVLHRDGRGQRGLVPVLA